MHKRLFKNFLLLPSKSDRADRGTGSRAPLGWLCFAVTLTMISSCAKPDWHFGTSGKYNEANTELIRGRAADVDKAINALQVVVQSDPTYRDSLTLLAKAYYRKGRYQETYAFAQRAIAVNKDDEIAWLLLGLAQLRLGDNAKGLESIKGGLTLTAKAMREEYRGYPTWDPRKTVRGTLNRAVFQALKGLDEKENLIQINEQLITRIDAEEYAQRQDKTVEKATAADD